MSGMETVPCGTAAVTLSPAERTYDRAVNCFPEHITLPASCCSKTPNPPQHAHPP